MGHYRDSDYERVNCKLCVLVCFIKQPGFTNTGWLRKWSCYQVNAIFEKGMNQEVYLLKFVFEKITLISLETVSDQAPSQGGAFFFFATSVFYRVFSKTNCLKNFNETFSYFC